jgi:hypothetical protein
MRPVKLPKCRADGLDEADALLDACRVDDAVPHSGQTQANNGWSRPTPGRTRARKANPMSNKIFGY